MNSIGSRASRFVLYVAVGLLLAAVLLTIFEDKSISVKTAEALVTNCHEGECYIWKDGKQGLAATLPQDYVDRLSCKAAGKVTVVTHEPYNGGEFFRVECKLGEAIISKSTIWNHFSSGLSIDVEPCAEGNCSFPQPI